MKEKLMKTYKKVELKAIKHSPEILAGVGVVGVVGSLVALHHSKPPGSCCK